jgi:hypothetical protein
MCTWCPTTAVGAIKREGGLRVSRLADTREDAVAYGRRLAKRDKVDLMVHGRDGTIQDGVRCDFKKARRAGSDGGGPYGAGAHRGSRRMERSSRRRVWTLLSRADCRRKGASCHLLVLALRGAAGFPTAP